MSELVGIINVTPDSFSDGGKYFDAATAINAIKKLIADGADVIDIGAESTRPGAAPIAQEEEWRRLSPVLETLPRFSGARFSIDTRHAKTAAAALKAGAHWINDVSGFADLAMVDAVKKLNCQLVVMHSLGIPADKNIVLDASADVVKTLMAFAQKRIDELEAAGIARGRIIFDPGIGFGKTSAQSLAIVERVKEFGALGVPLLIGHSRKSFLGENRDDATLAMSQKLAQAGVDYLRVHEVARHRAMLGAI